MAGELLDSGPNLSMIATSDNGRLCDVKELESQDPNSSGRH
jgi:hypothetical protein